VNRRDEVHPPEAAQELLFLLELSMAKRALRASEVTVAYRQSARWWVKLPWFRLKLWLARTR
jgi:hypothetical protein